MARVYCIQMEQRLVNVYQDMETLYARHVSWEAFENNKKAAVCKRVKRFQFDLLDLEG